MLKASYSAITIESSNFVFTALNGDIDRVQTIINKSSTSVITPDDSGYTALHYAARNGHFDICQMLLSNGAQVDAQTKSAGATPLHKAATVGNYINITTYYV